MSLKFKSVLLILIAIVFSQGFSVAMFGQAVNANLLGTVTDQTKAAVPKATVTITEIGTGISKTSQTNDSGNFDFEAIKPGTYRVTAEQSGFKRAVSEKVDVAVNSSVRVDLTLETGSISESVTVTAAPLALKTDRADVSLDVGSVQTENLPLGTNRNFQGVLALVPGATKPHFVHSNFFNAAASLSTEVNGQSRLANNTLIEGVDDNERSGLLQVLIPPNEAIQSVSVITSNYPAEFGRAGGAITNVTLKSGTNDFHGGAYEFNRVSALNAKNYFHPEHMPGSTYNYYGANLGGPIIHNKLFIFGDYLHVSDHQGQVNTDTVPTAAYRNGDFTAANSSAVYDPKTGNADGSGRKQISYNGVLNRLDPARISPIAKNILALIPLPNVPGSGLNANYVGPTNSTRDTNSFDVKVDDTLRGNDLLSYRYSWQKVDQFQSSIFGLAGGPQNGAKGSQTAYNTAVNYTHVLSPTLLTELRVGLNHYKNIANPLDYGSQATSALGIPGVNLDMFTSGITTIDLGGYSGSIIGTGASYPWSRGETNIDVVNNWTKIKGNHSTKFGIDVRRIRDDLFQGQVYGPRGVLQFRDGQTALKGGPKTGLANNFASFLLDIPNQMGRDVGVHDASWRETQVFAYGQDTWQATSKLTLTAGLRWELYVPPTPQRAGDYSNYDPNTNSLIIAGIGSNPMNLGMDTRYFNFAPRFGVAYRVDDKTVVRAGYGISYIPWPDNLNNYAVNYPLKQNNVYATTSSYRQAVMPDGTPASLAKGFVAPYIVPTPSDGIIANAPLASSYNVVNTHWKAPYIHSWNFAIQRALPQGFVLDVTYLGNVGIRTPQGYNMNAGMVAGAGANGQPLYQKWQKTAAVNYEYKQAGSNYNGLQVKLEHHFHDGFTSITSYSFQKAMGYSTSSGSGVGGTSIYIDFQRNYATLGNNRKHTFVQSYVYELPFGKGKKWMNTGVSSWMLGGWQTSGLISLESGSPFSVTASSAGLNAPSNTQLANITGPFRKLKGIGSASPWFDTSVFSTPAGAVLGNTGVNSFVGPGWVGWDASVAKQFPIRDLAKLLIRAEAFGVTNTPQFGNPSSNVSNGDFGQINGSSGGASNSRQMELSAKITF